jgi:ABC transport system ATP-binding/permease protein
MIGVSGQPQIVTIYGKSPDCDVVVDDPYVSARHAQVAEVIDGGAWLEDLGSTNGTWCRGVRVWRMPILAGTAFTVGRTEVTWPPG